MINVFRNKGNNPVILTMDIKTTFYGNNINEYLDFDDGNAEDSSGNGADGTVIGAVPVEGVSGTAMGFDGVDDCIVLDSPVVSNWPEGTIEVRVRYDSTTGPDGSYIFAVANGAPLSGSNDLLNLNP